MILNQKGQAGPLGEDLILLILLALSLAILLVSLNNSFINYLAYSAQLEMYRTALVLGDKISLEWAYNNLTPQTHLLDKNKICKNCLSSFSQFHLSYQVINLRNKTLLCSCGSNLSPQNHKVITLPVAIRFSQNKVHPGTLKIIIWK